jgi:transposase, IS30 family
VAIAEEADHIADVTIEPLSEMKNQVYTVTVDNSNEFSQHKRVAKALQAKVYFAHPYGAWERGSNENPHGLLRPYFPKGTSVKRVTQAKIRPAENRLNDRPRKSLEFRVPNDIFQHGKP